MDKKLVYCVDCDQEVWATIVEKEERYTVKNDGPFSIRARIPICPQCGAELFDEEIEAENQRKLYEKYRRKHGLLLPEEIRAIREKYGLSQKSFSRLLGFGEVTIHRYESGSIQDKAHDMIIRKAEDPAFLKECYERNPGAVAVRERKNLKERLEALLQEKANGDFLCGVTLPQIRKAIAVLLFMAHKVENLCQDKAHLLMWYADMLHAKKFGTSITGLQYEKHPSHPVPYCFDVVRRVALQTGALAFEVVPSSSNVYSFQTMAAFVTVNSDLLRRLSGSIEEKIRIKIYPRKEVEEQLFSPSELKTLEFIVQKLGKHTADTLEKVVKQEKAYQKVKMFDLIPYEFARFLSLDFASEG